jgi:predicted RNase H-like nuclease
LSSVNSQHGPNLPYSVVAGVAPTRSGWLVASAKLRGATFAPDEPRLFDSFRDVLDVRPPFQTIVVDVPIGFFDESSSVPRSCDREAQALLEGSAPAQSAPTSAYLFAEIAGIGGRDFAEGDYRLAREMYPSNQRVVHEGHPDLSFYQLNGYEALRWSRHCDDGRDERRTILERKVSGVSRVLDAKLPGIVARELNDVAVLLWTARRVFGHSAARLPSNGEWDSEGLRMELVM